MDNTKVYNNMGTDNDFDDNEYGIRPNNREQIKVGLRIMRVKFLGTIVVQKFSTAGNKSNGKTSKIRKQHSFIYFFPYLH